MAMSPNRWQEITPSQFPWEREALEYIRQKLPDHEPYRAWTNFEFIADDGSINEVDLLIITPVGLFLVEIKSRPGHLTGDAGTWMWKDETGRIVTHDNPLILTHRKAEKLAGMLRKQKSFSKVRFPFLEPLIFCSAKKLTWVLKGNGAFHVCFREKEGASLKAGILDALKYRKAPGMKQNVQATNKPIAKAVGRALEEVGIRPSLKAKRVGDYVLEKLIFQCPKNTYQDFEASHTTIKKVKRRVRIYNVSRTESQEMKIMIQKAAEREFQLLNTLSHEGILAAETLSMHESGPALIYQFDPDAMRLDHYLHQYQETIGVDIRLSLIRQIAEAIKYAHGKGVVHRALSPQCILVSNVGTAKPRIKILNWQAGRQTKDSTTSAGMNGSITIHPGQLMEDASLLYMSPEGLRSSDIIEPYIDVFSLGAITYHIFTGKPPASSVMDLTEKLNEQKGFDISMVLDGAGKELCYLIKYSTNPEVPNRMDTVDDFLEELQLVEDEFTEPDEEAVENPLDAKIGDMLEGGFEVKARLGKGGSATVFFVETRGKQVVLKLANKPELNERLKSEFKSMKKIHHHLIVEVYDEVMISGLYGFTMQRAGAKTLAQRLREEGPLQLEFLSRFGSDLIQIIEHLEDKGIYHRDFKPDNIGIGAFGSKGKLRLFLFDFSLAASSLDNVQVGTLKYHDPFLSTRKPVRWDVYAERFCVAMTLYEMATGMLPIWGDGISAPDMLSCEATLACESFDANIRKPLSDFFYKAFRRDFRKRFDNAEEMLKSWNQIFTEIEKPRAPSVHPTEEFDRDKVIQAAGLDTKLISLGLTPQALSALERINVNSVCDLLNVPFNEFRCMRGVGINTRNEIIKLTHDLHRANPDFSPEDFLIKPTITTPDLQYASIDVLFREIDKAGTSNTKPVLYAFLGKEKMNGLPFWPCQKKVMNHFQMEDDSFITILTQARSKWRKLPSVTRLREDITSILAKHGGFMSAPDLVTAVLTSRGSVLEEPKRHHLATAVCRATVEAEQGNQSRRFFDYRIKKGILVTSNMEFAAYADKLGDAADQLAGQEPLASPMKVIETLRGIDAPEGLPPIQNDNDLLKVAVYASSSAALSPRLEIYPRNMPALRMLHLSQGALVSVRELTVEELHHRVMNRYPEGAKLPGRTELDNLLKQAGLEMIWQASAANGQGAYRYKYSEFTMDTSGSSASRSSIQGASNPAITPEEVSARIFDRKLKKAFDEGAFLVLSTSGKYLMKALEALLNRFDLKHINFDDVFFPILKDTASRKKIKWDKVLKADAAPKETKDWKNLNILVSICMPKIEKTLSVSDKTILLSGIGLLARYDKLKLLDELRDQVGVTGSQLEGLWILIPGDEQISLPTVEGKAIPLLGSGQHARVPKQWIKKWMNQKKER